MPFKAEVTQALPCAAGLDGGSAGAVVGALEAGMLEAGAPEAGALDAGAVGALLGEAVDDGVEPGAAWAGDDGLDCPVYRTGTDRAGHFGAVAVEMWLRFPPARQA